MAAPRVSFKVTILTLFLVLTVALSALVLTLSYRRNSEATLRAAERLLEEEAQSIVATTERLIDPLFTVTNSAVRLPGVDAAAGQGFEHALAPVMFGVLERYPQMTAVYIGNGRGEFYRIAALNAVRSNARAWLQAPPQAAFAQQSIATERGRRVEHWRFLDAARREVGAAEGDESYDPRKRPWYVAAMNSKEAIVTDYYPFAAVPQIGLTVARSVGDAKQTVFGVDLTLTSISRFLAKARASQLADARSAEIAVFNGNGQLLAHSDSAAYERLLNASDTPRIPRVSEVGAGVMPKILAHGAHGTPAQLRVAGPDGAEWLAHVTKLTPAFGERTYVALAVPVAEVLGPLARSARDTLFVSLAVVIAFLPLVYLAAGAVSAPLHRLTGEIARLKNFDMTPTPPVRTLIAEIQDLGAALAGAKFMLGAFAKYVPKNLVRQIYGSGLEPKLGGERRPLTVFFSDVRDFTTISEQVPPERLIEFTSQYLDGLVTVLLQHRATVDKFVGDEIMAYWNAPTPNPSHATDGCLALLRCRDWSNAQNARWAREGTPQLYTRFALHLGEAIVGNIGSSDRMDYTVVGAAINLASRIEGLNKIYGTQVLITRPVADAIDGHFVRRPVDRVLPKGAVHPLDVLELRGVLPGHAVEADLAVDINTVALCEVWTRFYQRYLGRDWDAAGEALTDFIARFGEDSLARIYVERIRRFKAEPPAADWDGVIRYSTK
ncbi:MAG TPA: adenylate/guanylate cyclase domain-containing protein [Burkholderiales bacterium]|nr:adenylate/guanylate cyclase domain-containing protein [Burkholderiales bacterium]